MTVPNSYRAQPDERGHFGDFGGRYVAETLMPLILELEAAYRAAKVDPAFHAQFDDLLEHYVGRPSPLYYAERLTEALRESAPEGKGAQVWFKRDELNHTGAHKINNCIGQILLAMRMGKTRIIAETGAGQHGVATATVCAPDVTALTLAPSSFMRNTLGFWRSTSTAPMKISHGILNLAHTVATATPCWPAPVSAMTRVLPMRLASRIWPMQLLILCEPVWFSSSRLRYTFAPPSCSVRRSAR